MIQHAPVQYYAYQKGALKLFNHNGTMQCNGRATFVFTTGGRMQDIIPRRCCWCGSRYMYMASVPQNMQRYCPGCKPIRDKEMLALYIWNRQRPKTVFRKSNGKKDRLKKSTQYTKQWKIENKEHLKEYQFGWKAKNKDSEKNKRILRNSKKTPEQRAEDNRKDREYRQKKRRHDRALESIQVAQA